MSRKSESLTRTLISPVGLFARLTSVLAIAALLVTAVEITQARWVLAAGNYASAVAADLPVGYWRLDEASGTTAADFSGTHTNPLAYQGGYTLNTNPGAISGDADSAVALNGTTGAVTATKAPTAGTTNFSLEAWVNPSTLPQAGVIAYNGQENSNGYGFAIGTSSLASGSHLIGIVGGVGTFDSGYNFAAPNTWYHVVMTRDTTTIRVYVNSILQATTSSLVPVAPGARFSLGSAFTSTSAQVIPLAGSIDEAASYNTLLSAGRIQAHFTEGASATSAYGNWATASPSGPPTARFEPSMGWDAGHSKVVLFGGKNSSGVAIQETWTWDGATWTKLTPATQPSARWGAQLVYDTALSKMVLFGGRSGTTSLSDTWTWNGTTWASVSPGTIPAARLEYGLAYDKANSLVVMFGGTTGSAALQDTYTFNGTNWTLKAPAAKPSIRSQVAMAYDDSTSNTVLYGGVSGSTYNAETWTWNGTNWTLKTPTAAASARGDSGLAYNSVTGSMVLIGGVNGSSYFGDTWTWDGTNWSLQSPATSPIVRAGAGFASNGVSGNNALFGGLSGATYKNDTLAWNTPPAAPTGVTPVAGNTQASVSWVPPATGGLAITGYTVTPYVGNTPGTATAASASPATVTGLTNGTTYTFKVVAKNSVGNGPSATSIGITPATVPTVSTSVTANPGNLQATLNWLPPASNGGSAVTGYTAQIGTGTCPVVSVLQTQSLGAVSSTTFSSLSNGQQYCAQVSASNVMGAGPYAGATVTPFGAPGAPTGVGVSGGNHQVTINWSAPTINGGAAITGYVAQIWAGSGPSGGALQTQNLGAAAVTNTFTGLTNGQQYWAQVSATNGITGPPSGNTATPSSVPDAPTVTPTPGNGQVSLAWAAVSGQGSTITKYTAKAWQGSNNLGTVVGTQTLSSSATSALFTGLTDGQPYYFEVWATNANGDGGHGSATSTPLGPPSSPSLTPSGGNQSATVTWVAPNNNGAAITGYTASIWLGTDTNQTPLSTQSPGASATSATFTALTNGQLYTVGVAAINSQGTGAKGYVQVTPSTIPGAPSVTATPANLSAVVNWTPPSNGGSAITGYTAKIWTGTDTNQTPLQTQSLAGSAFTWTFSGLTNGQLYTVGVYATNLNGSGALATAPVTPATLALAPGSVAATSGNASANLTWTVPANGGSAITSYQITWTGGSTTVNAPATSTTISSLVNGTSYVFSVAATNSIGTGPATASNPVVVGTPSVPGTVSATGAASQATVTWTAATANGSAVTSYLVVAGSGQAISVGGSATSATLSGLPGGVYSLTVVATNSLGAGPPGGPANATVTGGVTYASTVRGDSPAAYYRLDDPSGSVAADSSGSSRHATYSGGITQGSAGLVASDSDGAATLDGSSASVVGPALASLAGGSARSVEVWFKTTSTTQMPLFDAGNSGSAYQAFAGYLTQSGGQGGGPPINTAGLAVAFGSDDVYIPSLNLADGSPHQVIATLSGRILTIWVDGRTPAGYIWNGSSWTSLTGQPFTLPTTPNTAANPLWIGHSRASDWGQGSTWFNGTIDEVSVYAAALTAAQVAARVQSAGYLAATPASVQVTTPANQQVSTTWTESGTVQGFLVTAYLNGTTAQNSVGAAGSATSAVLTGLQAGQSYTVKVTAFNSFGASSPGVSASFIPTGTPGATYASTVIGSGPSAYYRLGEPGGSLAADSSGTGNPATYAGTPLTLGASGALPSDPDTGAGFGMNCCSNFQLYGGSEVRSSPAMVLPTGNSARSVELWINTTNAGTMALAGWGTSSTRQAFQLRLLGGNQIGVVTANDDIYLPAPYSLADGTWHQVVVTYDGSTLALYVNGQLASSQATAWTSRGGLNTALDGNGLVLAHDFWCGVGCTELFGNLDEVSVYSSALAAGAVSTHFAASGNSRPTAPGSVIAAAGNNSATVTWTAATAGGAPVASYIVTAYANGTLKGVEIAVGGSTLTATLTGLNASTSYSFTVTGYDRFGAGTESSQSAAVLVAGTPGLSYAATVGSDSPLIFYRLGDLSGPVAPDSSGNGRLAIYNGSPLGLNQPGAIPGDSNGSVNFNRSCCSNFQEYGGDDVQFRPASPILPAANTPRSIEVWIQTTNTGTMGIAGYGTPNTTQAFELRLVNGNQVVLVGYNDDRTFTAPYTLANGSWHQLIVTYDGTSALLYVDGLPSGSAAQSWSGGLQTVPNNDGFIIGRDFWCGQGCSEFRGNLDEVSLYSFALPAAQVAAHFSASGNSRPTAPTGVNTSSGAANAATINWTAATSTGYPVSGYVVTALANGTRGINSVAVGGSATTASLSGLTAGVSYTFTVTGYDNFGAGPASAPSASVTPTGASNTYPLTVLNDTPFAYYRLGEPSGTIAADSSGGGRVGSYNGSPLTLAQAGAIVGDSDTATGFGMLCCSNFQNYGGSETQVRPITGLPLGNSARSIELWVKTTQGGTQGLAGWGSANTHSEFALRLVNGTTLSIVSFNDDRTFATPYSVSDGQWHQIVIAYDGSNLTAYLDGLSLGPAVSFSSSLTTVLDDNGLILGHDPWCGVGCNELFGSLDEVSVYSYALNSAQVGNHFAASGEPSPSATPGPPTGVNATGGVNQATVTWTAPTNTGGTAISGYAITPHAGTSLRTPSFVGVVTSATVGGLSGGTTYTFTVAAINSAGPGTGSAPSNTVTPTGQVYPYSLAILGDAPAAYWRLGESAGTAAVDAAGNGNTGFYSGVFTQAAPGGIRNDPDLGVTLDGISGHVFARNSSGLSITGGLSLEAWAELSSTATTQLMVSKGDGTTGGSAYELAFVPGTGFVFDTFNSAGMTRAVAATSVAAAKWYHVVGTRGTGGALTIYVDGVISGSASDGGSALNAVNASIGIGFPGVGSASPFGGSLDEAAIYPSALTANQVANHWQLAAYPAGGPTGVSALAAADNQATVSWTAPANSGGSAITGYRVTPHAGARAGTPVLAAAGTTSATVSGLSGGSGYTFTVAALNATGLSVDSAPSTSVTVTGSTSYPYSTAVTGDGAAGFWRLGEAAGLPATDASGQGNSGSYLGGISRVQPGAIQRDPDKGLSLDGSSGHVLVADAPALAITGDLTVEAWVNFASVAGTQVIVGKGDGSSASASAYQLAYVAGTGFTFTTYVGTVATQVTEAINATPAAWYQVVGTRTSAGVVTIYVNCQPGPLGRDPGTPLNVVGSALGIGSTGSGTGSHLLPLIGSIDEVAVYPVALTHDAVGSHWQKGGYTPDGPTSVVAVAGTNQVSVSWSPPAYHGTSPISGYLVTANRNGIAAATQSVDSASTSVNFANLIGGAAYTFTVTAINGSGSCGTPSAQSNTVTPGQQVLPQLGQALKIVTTSVNPLPQGSFSLTSSGVSLPTWTIEGFIWDLGSNGVTGGNTAWGVLGTQFIGDADHRKTVPSTGSPVAGINFDVGARAGIGDQHQSYFVWPGDSYPIPSDASGLPVAADSPTGGPAHFALDYDGTTVRGFINGQLLFTRTAVGAAISGQVGIADNQELRTGAFDELRVSTIARYSASFSTPTTAFASDASTALLLHFEGRGIQDFFQAPVLVPPVCGDPPVYTASGIFAGDVGSDVAATWWGNCQFTLGPEFYHVLSFGQSPGAAETRSPSEFKTTCEWNPFPVNCATGEFWHTFTDLTVPGRGVPLSFSRSYTSANANTNGRLGFGWTDSYNLGLSLDGQGNATIREENSSQIAFALVNGVFQPAPRVLASLVHNGDGTYTFTRRDQTQSVFDSAGRLTKQLDRNGYATLLAYDGQGRLATVTDPALRTLTFGYDAANHIQTITDPANRQVSFGYNSAGELISSTDVGLQVTGYAYESSNSHRLTVMTDPRLGTITTQYDGSGRVQQQSDQLNRTTHFAYAGDQNSIATTTITDPKGNVTVETYSAYVLLARTLGSGTAQAATWQYGYDPLTLAVSTVTDPLGYVTSMSYDVAGNLLSSTDPLGHTTRATYNTINNPVTNTDALNVTSSMTYDAHGNLATSSRPLTGTSSAAAVTYVFDPARAGDVLQVIDPDSKTSTSTYDAYGNRTSATDPLGNKATFVYDNVGRMLSSVSPRGNVTGADPNQFTTTYQVNAYGQPTLVTDPLQHTIQYVYDADGNVHQVIDANAHTTTYTYDAANQLQLVSRNDSSTQAYAYDADGNLQTVTDGLSNPYGFTYDPLNRIATATDPLQRKTIHNYDAAGRLSSAVDAANRTTSYSYDANGEVVSVSYSDGVTPGVSYSYDAAGRVVAMNDGTGTTTYGYDSLHRLVQSTDGAGSGVGYGYDLRGNLTSLTYPGSGHVVQRGYDDAGRLTSVGDWLSHSTTYQYSADSALTGVIYPNGVLGTYGYDNADRLTSIGDALGQATPFLSLNYGRDPLGQLTTDTGKGFGYDGVNRLQTATSAGVTSTYGFDNADRLTSVAVGGGGNTTTYAFDAADQASSQTITQGSTQLQKYTFGFDPLGQRTSRTDTSNTTVAYGYDQTGRLTSYNSGQATYSYNGAGLRMAKTVGSTTTRFAWDLADGLPLLLVDGTTSYVSGLGGVPLEQISQSGAVLYYHSDQLGSTRALTDGSGAVVATSEYDSYGALFASTGSASNPFGYAGQYTDAESGLQYLRARYYDSSTQQFLTRDPAILLAPYAYAGGSPTNASDPSGLSPNWGAAFNALAEGGAQILADHQWLAYVPFIGTALMLLTAYNDARHCDFAGAAGIIAGVAIGLLLGGVAAGVMGKIGAGLARSEIRAEVRAEGKAIAAEGAAKVVDASAGASSVERGVAAAIEWLGPRARAITNEAGDKIFLSEDGLRKIRFDINRPYPHEFPHGHVEELVNGKWVKSGPIWPADVPAR
jgi:RHS repeat-associated protein